MKESSNDSLEKFHLELLKLELNKRQIQNNKYSVRQYADDAGISPGTMSQYLNEKRKLSSYSFELIIKKLRIDSEMLEKYEQHKIDFELLQKKYQLIKTHWYYYSILELTNVNGFKADAKWIADKLELSFELVEQALCDLFDIGALARKDGTFVDTLGNVTFIDSPNMDIKSGRQYQKELIEKAINSIDTVDGALKDHTSICFALDTALLPEIKKRIQLFHKETIHFVEKNSKNLDSVYAIQVNVNSHTK